MGLSLARFGGVNPADAASMPFNKFYYYYKVLRDEFETNRKRNITHNSRLLGSV